MVNSKMVLLIALLLAMCSFSAPFSLFGWDDIEDNGKLNCLFKLPGDIFSCRSPTGIIECKSNTANVKLNETATTIINHCKKTFNTTDFLQASICLFPKTNNNRTVNESESYPIYFSKRDNQTTNGIRIIDSTCYNLLVGLLENDSIRIANTIKQEAINQENIIAKEFMKNVARLNDVARGFGEFLSFDLLKKRFVQKSKKHNHRVLHI